MADTAIGPGSVLAGRYRLEDLLEEAAGAKFWRATDQILARSVAVHVVAIDDPRAGALLAAARTSATVTDPHFLRVLDAAQEDGVAYVVNEWGSGMSLDRILASEPLPPRRAAWVVKEVADAVITAHRHGVSHGRLLPENVMVTEAGAVKLIGFVVDAALHTPGPAGESEDAQRDDVSCLAGLLYAALVGKWPGATTSVLPEAPREHGRVLRPRQVRAGVPRPLDAICDRVLNAEASRHEMPLRTAHEISAALSDYIGDPAGASQMGHEPTTVLRRDDLETQAFQMPGLRADAAADPEQTQAGTPVFFDETIGTGWTAPGQSRGLRGDHPETRRRPAPPPPPPLPEPEPRPLFAPDPPGGRARRTPPEPVAAPWGHSGSPPPPPRRHRGHDTGHGTGSLPAIWGPDADAPPPADGSGWAGEEPPGRSWLKLAAVIGGCLVLLVAVVLAVNLGFRPGADGDGLPGSEQSPTAGASQVLEIAGVTDFDPEGDPAQEHPELAPLAIDGKPDTAWQTMTYRGNPKLGLLKDGVGLVVDLGTPAQVAQVRLTLRGNPTDLEILAAPEGAPAPTGVAGLDTVATARGAGESVDLTLKKPVTTRFLVVWLTSLPPASGGFRGQIAEIVVRS